MAQRDYAARRGKKKKPAKRNKLLLIIIALIILLGFGGALFLLKEKSPETAVSVPKVVEKKQPKSVLPNRPEEVWSYIKALETRTIPVDNNPASVDKNMQLTAEQKKILLEMEKEQKQAEAQRKTESTEQIKQNAQATEKKSQKPTAPAPITSAEPAKTVKTEQKVESRQESTTSANAEKKYGLQCGTFKNRENAENLQARLATMGLNARVSTSGEWYRVQVGSVGNRDAAVKAQGKAKSVIDCVVIGI